MKLTICVIEHSIKTVRGKERPFVNCIVRDKDIQLKPEEVVRQLYADKAYRSITAIPRHG